MLNVFIFSLSLSLAPSKQKTGNESDTNEYCCEEVDPVEFDKQTEEPQTDM